MAIQITVHGMSLAYNTWVNKLPLESMITKWCTDLWYSRTNFVYTEFVCKLLIYLCINKTDDGFAYPVRFNALTWIDYIESDEQEPMYVVKCRCGEIVNLTDSATLTAGKPCSNCVKA